MLASNDVTVVIGHKRPDLDSIASAIGYATLLREEGGKAIAARAGQIDEQTSWALGRFSFDAPEALMDVAPTFGAIAGRLATSTQRLTLGEAIRALAAGARALPILDGDTPVALVDARVCVEELGKGIGERDAGLDSLLGKALLGSGPSGHAPVMFRADERVAERRGTIARLDVDDYFVVDELGRYVGIASRAVALAPPLRRLVLVDHNELGQAVAGTDQAEVIEVIDHHKLGNPATSVPIPFVVDVVGSTATLVEERWRLRRGAPSASLAGLLLSALLSDTLAFRSPTCTERDKRAASRLAETAGIADLSTFGDEVVLAGTGLGQRDPDEIVSEDSKEFMTSKGLIVVAQAEVRTLHEIGARAAELEAALGRLLAKRGAVLAALLLTDPVRATSRLIATGDVHLVARVPFGRAGDGIFDAPSVVSRKKQLVPALLAALENG